MNQSHLIALPSIMAVVPAAGVGRRMLSQVPKQYLRIGEKTLLEYVVYALLDHSSVQQVIVTISQDDPYFDTLSLANEPRVQWVIGGKRRADSVLAGVKAAEQAEWILVHDAARPCVHPDDISKLLALSITSQVGGILATPVRDTMKRTVAGATAIAHTVEREGLWHALTPQFFPRALLQMCLERALSEHVEITDEASALEHCGYYPQLILGRADNIKVTQPEDMALAAYYLSLP